MQFADLVGVDRQPDEARPAVRVAVDTDTYANEMIDEPRNNGFVSGVLNRRRGERLRASRRGFLRSTLAAAAAATAASGATLFGPARTVQAQSGVVGTYPRRILQYCPPLNSGDNCQPGCGSSPICTDCCGADGFFRNEPGNGYTLYAGGCGDGDIADGWLWRFSGKCGNCAEIEYRCSDGFVQTDAGPAPFICRTVTACVPLADGEAPGEALPDAARPTNWRPAGSLELAVDQGNTVAITGWIADGSGNPVQMRIRANNMIMHLGAAALPRPDIERSRPGAGPNTGFAVSFPIDPGTYEFCVDAIAGNVTATVGCVRMNVGSGGSVRGNGATGSLPAPPASNDATPAEPAPASATNAEDTAASAEPTPTPGVIVLPELSAATAAPTFGALQVIRRTAEDTGFVSGWAGDPDTDEPAYIEVLVDGQSVALARTDLPRRDVARAFPQLNSATGFAISFPLPAAASEVCVVAVSPDDGRRQPLGCQQLSPAPEPRDEDTLREPTATGGEASISPVVYGAIDNVTLTNGGVRVDGWAFDPNDRDREVSITAVASGVVTQATTGLPHDAARRIYGVDANCGFSFELTLPPGTHNLDIAAFTSAELQVPLDRETVVVP